MAQLVRLDEFRRIKDGVVVNNPALSPSRADRIVIIEDSSAVPGQQVEIGLEVEPNITKAKAVEIQADGAFQLGSVATKDGARGPVFVRLPIGDIVGQGSFVVLKKAEILGLTGRYKLFVDEFKTEGSRFTFLWGAD